MADDEGGFSALVPPSRGTVGRVVRPARPGRTTLEIAELLLGVPQLRDASLRSVIVAHVEERVGAKVIFSDEPHPLAYYVHLVSACCALPDGLAHLMEAVEHIAGRTVAVSELRRQISPAQEHLGKPDETQIRTLLAGWRVPSLARLYHAAAWARPTARATTGSPTRGTPSTRCSTTTPCRTAAPRTWSSSRCCSRRRGRGSGPRRSAGATSTSATGWRRGSSGSARTGRSPRPTIWRGCGTGPSSSPPTPTSRSTSSSSWTRSPARTSTARCRRLSHWRQVHPLEWRPEPGEDRLVPLSEVPAQVGELIREAESDWAYQLDDALSLEFVLPLELINLDLDQWTRDPSDTPHPRPLGAEYEILIRSRERLRTRTLHRAWRRRWQVLVEAARCSTHWAEADADVERLSDRLLSDEGAVACVLSGPPDDEHGREELWMAVRAGVPVVVWHRESDPPQEARDALHHVVGRPDLRGLPGDIKRMRGRLAGAAWSGLPPQPARRAALGRPRSLPGRGRPAARPPVKPGRSVRRAGRQDGQVADSLHHKRHIGGTPYSATACAMPSGRASSDEDARPRRALSAAVDAL